ncbi:MAG: hypothetical protein WCD18_01275 [Thermosynechococcaceae cyanobacterium]
MGITCPDSPIWDDGDRSGHTQQQAIAKVLAFDTGDPRPLSILRLLTMLDFSEPADLTH